MHRSHLPHNSVRERTQSASTHCVSGSVECVWEISLLRHLASSPPHHDSSSLHGEFEASMWLLRRVSEAPCSPDCAAVRDMAPPYTCMSEQGSKSNCTECKTRTCVCRWSEHVSATVESPHPSRRYEEFLSRSWPHSLGFSNKARPACRYVKYRRIPAASPCQDCYNLGASMRRRGR